jgi:hypothetical protein
MRRLLSGLVGLLMFFSTTANIFAELVVTADEFGHGTWDGASLLWSSEADPTEGVVGQNVLIYRLPSVVYAGDVVLTAPGQNNLISDIIRFCNVGGVGMMIFYSDGTNGIDSLADVSGDAWGSLIFGRTPPEIDPIPHDWIPSPPLTWISEGEVYHTIHEWFEPTASEVTFTAGATQEQILSGIVPGTGYDIEYHFTSGEPSTWTWIGGTTPGTSTLWEVPSHWDKNSVPDQPGATVIF